MNESHGLSGPRGFRAATYAGAVLALAAVAPLAILHGRRSDAQAAASLAAGEALYAQHCSVCHGASGAGDGTAAYLLSPAPRDFTSGRFRIASTHNGVPSDDDLVATLKRGMPGSAMPPWDFLPETELQSLAAFVRKLAIDGKANALLRKAAEDEDELSEAEAREIAVTQLTPGAPIDLGEPPPTTPVTLQEGRRVFMKSCALCHGADGTGRGAKDQENEDGTPTKPRDFTAGIFKGGATQRDFVTRLRVGMAGSPMPSQPFDDPSQAWAVAAYVESLVAPGAQERMALRIRQIRAKRVRGELPREPRAAVWSQAEPHWLAMAPLWWRDDRVEGFVLRALHDDRDIAFKLSWEDATRDDEILGQLTFCDAAALQLTNEPAPPMLTMGSAGHPVNIWQWKAAWERDLAGVRDVASFQPNTPDDSYGHVAADDEPMYLTAAYANNGQAARTRATAGDVLTAEGFGTLAPLAGVQGGFSARGEWADGFWDVVLTRTLAPRGKAEVSLAAPGPVFLAGAIWQGGEQDRNGQKSVTVWHVLEIER